MTRSVTRKNPRRAPEVGVGQERGQQELSLRQQQSIASIIDELYEVFQAAVDASGGTVVLAASMEKGLTQVSLRVRHAPDSKGEVQRATLDMLGHVVADQNGRRAFLFGLCDRWNFKHPDQKCDPSVQERYRFLLARLAGSASGDAILKDAAEANGYDVGIFRRP